MEEIFVFGSNLAGRHGKGAALYAKKHHGAIQGQGEGLQDRSYGIPTKDEKVKTLPLERIQGYISIFIAFAKDHPELTFRLTPIGCGLAGYSPEQIAPMFHGATNNIVIPLEFSALLGTELRPASGQLNE